MKSLVIEEKWQRLRSAISQRTKVSVIFACLQAKIVSEENYFNFFSQRIFHP